MKLIFSVLLFIGFWSGLFAQNKIRVVDKVMLQIPESLTYSTLDIAGYINSNFSTQNDKARATFIWIAKNIRYDLANMYVKTTELTPSETNFKTLKTRKGVCNNYAALFNDIAGKVGIKSYVISGYTKQHGVVDILPHAWCAALIDGEWFMFDPTWGSGTSINGNFIRQINEAYYKVKPSELIESHMPFDPLFQLLTSPITNQEFYEAQSLVDGNKRYFNFNDSLLVYDQQSEVERLIASSNRIEKNGIKNSMILEQLQYNRTAIEYYKTKYFEVQYNLAIDSFNAGVNMLNEFSEYYNRQFTPLKSDAEIQQMIDSVETCFNNARNLLNGIKETDARGVTLIKQLNKTLNDTYESLLDKKAFLRKYFNTRKMFRKSLFYKYTHVGVSINKNQ